MRDDMLDLVLTKSRSMLVPWFLMASYLYYQRDHSLLSDARYDQLCRDLDAEWPAHRHRYAVDRAGLSAGTAYAMRVEDYPPIVVNAACHLAGLPTGPVHTLAEHRAAQMGDLL